MNGNTIPPMLTHEQLAYGRDKLWDSISEERRRIGVVVAHEHGGGSQTRESALRVAFGRGFKNYQTLEKRMSIRPGSLPSYLEVIHEIDEIQSGGLEFFHAAMIDAVHNLISTQGTVPLLRGERGSTAEPLFPISHVFLRLNMFKRTGRNVHGTDTLVDADLIMLELDNIARRFAVTIPDVKVRFIGCFGRELKPEINKKLSEKLAKWTVPYRSLVGVDIAGPEDDHKALIEGDDSSPLFLPRMYGEAAGTLLAKTIHCGETKFVDVDTFCRSLKLCKPQ